MGKQTELIDEITLDKEITLKLYSDLCFKPGIGEYDSLFWKYCNGDKEIAIDATLVTSLLASKAFKKLSKSFLSIL